MLNPRVLEAAPPPPASRRQQLARRWRDLLARWRWVAVPLAIAVASRVAVLALAYVGDHLLPTLRALGGEEALTGHPFLDRWYKWDAAWYAAVALNGYQPDGPNAPGLAFWPLLPLLTWGASRPLALAWPDMPPVLAVAWAGLAVAFAAFAVACVLLYRLVLDEEGPDTARRAVALLAFAPGALFFTAVYPEGLLLIGVAGCFWALHRGRWALAGLAGLWAALAHVPGCLLAFPFAYEYLRRQRRPSASALWVLLIPLGPALWLAYLWTLSGDPLAPVTAAHTFWPHRTAWPWETLAEEVPAILGGPRFYPLGLVDLAAAAGGLGASLWALRTGRASWGIWGLAVLVLYLSNPADRPLVGMLRYTLPVLPLWLLVARLTRHPAVEAATLAALAMFLSLLTALFVNAHWVA